MKEKPHTELDSPVGEIPRKGTGSPIPDSSIAERIQVFVPKRLASAGLALDMHAC